MIDDYIENFPMPNTFFLVLLSYIRRYYRKNLLPYSL